MVKWAALLLLASATAAGADLAHRVPLYPLYAGDPDGALLAWLEADLVPGDDDQRLMLATLYQARGLVDEARALLRPVAEGSGPLGPAARVHLARLDAQHPERVLAWLADVAPPPRLADTAAHLRLQALIRLGRLKAAASALRHAPPPARAYARYNLAVAWQARGEMRRARRQLRRLVREGEGGGPVLRALADEARLALAFLDLKDGHPRRAERTLLAVRQDGPQAPRALLGLAWARLADGRPADVLAPLARLTALDDPLAAEGRLALAHAYERLGRPGAALAAYRAAERDGQTRLAALERRLARLADGHLPPAFDAAPEALAADPEGRALHQALDDPGVQAAYRAWMRAWHASPPPWTTRARARSCRACRPWKTT